MNYNCDVVVNQSPGGATSPNKYHWSLGIRPLLNNIDEVIFMHMHTCALLRWREEGRPIRFAPGHIYIMYMLMYT